MPSAKASLFLPVLVLIADLQATAATLVEKGQARAVIVVPEKPSPIVQNAARVLQDHIKQMSGAELPIRTEDRITGSPTQGQAWVLVGEGKLAEKLGLTSKGLGPGGIVQSAKGNVVALFGTDAHTPADPHGTRYAVTTFLGGQAGGPLPLARRTAARSCRARKRSR